MLFDPQHGALPSVFNPQVWNAPTLTEVKVPVGGADSP